jgi:putative transposase
MLTNTRFSFHFPNDRKCPAYFVTCYAGHRRNCFVDPACVEDVTRQLLHLAAAYHFEVSAYCFMPDHVQLVLEAVSIESGLSPLMGTWKRKTSGMHERSTGAKLWQSGYHDHRLMDDAERMAAIRRLLTSPVRAGLVSDLRRYRFWGSGVWDREELLDYLGVPDAAANDASTRRNVATTGL